MKFDTLSIASDVLSITNEKRKEGNDNRRMVKQIKVFLNAIRDAKEEASHRERKSMRET